MEDVSSTHIAKESDMRLLYFHEAWGKMQGRARFCPIGARKFYSYPPKVMSLSARRDTVPPYDIRRDSQAYTAVSNTTENRKKPF